MKSLNRQQRQHQQQVPLGGCQSSRHGWCTVICHQHICDAGHLLRPAALRRLHQQRIISSPEVRPPHRPAPTLLHEKSSVHQYRRKPHYAALQCIFQDVELGGGVNRVSEGGQCSSFIVNGITVM